MPARFDALPHRRAIIDRRSIGDALVALEGSDRAKLRSGRDAPAQGRARRGPRGDRTAADRAPLARARIAASQAFLIDQICACSTISRRSASIR